jgi:hypothetical protein
MTNGLTASRLQFSACSNLLLLTLVIHHAMLTLLQQVVLARHPGPHSVLRPRVAVVARSQGQGCRCERGFEAAYIETKHSL